jgi:hypothetical protein
MAAGNQRAELTGGTADSRAAGTSRAVPDPVGDGTRRPWWVWTVPFVLLFAVLCVRNRFLFTAHLYEQGDTAADSILIEQAKHFTLLIGNYSREGFNHPGPAYMYVQAFGQYLFLDALHLVPTAWNADMLSVFALDSAFVALAVGVVYGWTRSVRGAAACFAVFLAFAVVHPPIVNSDWMPYMYVPAYMVFVIAAGSVAAGQARDAWIFALSGWFLIHGHACFLLFVPALTVTVAVAVLWPRRRRLRASLRSFSRQQRGTWVSVAVISAVFLLPIAINLLLHWPGDFGKYFSYGSSARAGGHSAGQVVRYALWFWWPHGYAWLAPVLLVALALAVITWLGPFWPRPDPLRRFLIALLAVNAVSSLAFLCYAAVGIDALQDYYIGYFYWSAPLVMVLIVAVGAVQAVRAPKLDAGLALLAAGAALAVFAVIPGTRTSTSDIDESLPHVVATLAARSPGKTIVLRIDHAAWPQAAGVLVQAERTGVRACLDDPALTVIVTARLICTPAQAADGATYWLYRPAPRGVPVILRFSGVAVAAARS